MQTDGRTDDQELSTNCSVHEATTPTGTVPPQSVTSDPLKSDTDSDGLSDWAECMAYYTNPGNSDSDDDGTLDGTETGGTPIAGLHRDPLKADRIITFDFDKLHVYGDCDTSGLYAGAELHNQEAREVSLKLSDGTMWYGDIPCSHDGPGRNTACYESFEEKCTEGSDNPVYFPCPSFGGACNSDGGEVSFLLHPGEWFQASNVGTWHECDAGAAPDETLSNWGGAEDDKYTYDKIVGGTYVREWKSSSNDAEYDLLCSFGIFVSIDVK